MPSPGWTSIHLEVEPQPARAAVGEADPFRILILGDFSGYRGPLRPRADHPVTVDCDTLDDVIARIRPTVSLPLEDGADAQSQISFQSFEDFHPDSLYTKVPIFQHLSAAREKLAKSPWKSSEPPAPAVPPPAPAPPSDPGGSLLDAILNQQSPAPAAAPPGNGVSGHKNIGDDEWKRIIDRIVAPHVSPAQDPRQLEAIKAVDHEIEGRMRSILHHPDFQQIEAAWRTLDFLLRRLEVGPGLSLHIFDLSYENFRADLAAAPDPESSQLHRLLMDEAGGVTGGDAWTVVVCLYQFDPAAAEIEALSRAAQIANRAHAPLLLGATPRLVGAKTFESNPDPRNWKESLDAPSAALWRSFRRAPESRWLGLAMPRFLLRLPYGKQTSSLDLFEFEEMPKGAEPEHYLWGNPAAVCVCVLVTGLYELTGIPVHTYKSGPDVDMTPCAEMWFNERSVEHFLEAGVMPLASIKNRDSVRLLRLQSVNIDYPQLPVAGAQE